MVKKKEPKVEKLIFDSYLAVIKNSLGSKMFNSLFAKVGGKKTDVMRNGELSCAFYVSSLLVALGFIDRSHATVASTVEAMKKAGWKRISKPRTGSVLIWEKVDLDNKGLQRHIGFYMGKKKAVSHSWIKKTPVEHSYDFGGKRKIEEIFWNPKLK